MQIPIIGNGRSSRLPNGSRNLDSGPVKAPYHLETKPYFAKSPMGTEIFIRRKRSLRNSNSSLPAVALCHGLGNDSNIFSLSPSGRFETFSVDHIDSVSNYLAHEGKDVFLVHLSTSERVFRRFVSRFCGESSHYGDENFRTLPTITFDYLAEHEIDAAIKRILQIRKEENSYSDGLIWTGHSMGGMLGYARAGYFQDQRIEALVVLASPAHFGQALIKALIYLDKITGILMKEENLVDKICRSIQKFGGAAALAYRIPLAKQAIKIGFQPNNVNPVTAASYFGQALEPIPPKLKDQFLHWAGTQTFTSMGKGIDYLKEMGGIRCPVFQINGGKDYLAPPLSVAIAFNYLGSNSKTRLLLENYGHGELAFGKNVIRDVALPISEWINHLYF